MKNIAKASKSAPKPQMETTNEGKTPPKYTKLTDLWSLKEKEEVDLFWEKTEKALREYSAY